MSTVILVLLAAAVGVAILAMLVGALFAIVYFAGSSGRRGQLRRFGPGPAQELSGP